MRRTIAFALTPMLVAGAASAIAVAGPYPTTVTTKGTAPLSGSKSIATGTVTSPKNACVPGRTVELTTYDGDQNVILTDSGTTNKRGIWAAAFKPLPGGHVKVKALRSKIGRPGHRSTCSAGKDAFG